MNDHHQFPEGLFTRFPELQRDVGSPFAGALFIDAPSGAVQGRVDKIVRDVMRHRPTGPAEGGCFVGRVILQQTTLFSKRGSS
jgi:hypothetical protein